jgi:Polyketide synthase dehydratase N-terminal domain
VIRFKHSATERSKLSKKVEAALDRAESLEAGLKAGTLYQFNRSMIYKMVGALAQFDSKYTGLSRIVLDSDAREACGTADFSTVTVDSDSRFHTHPAYIDAVSQIAGFVMNCNHDVNLDEKVFMNHGWRGFCLFEKLHRDKAYQLHVKMHEVPGNRWQGDITIMDEHANIVAFFEGITVSCPAGLNICRRLVPIEMLC